jgi:hypothetical protein
MAKIKITKRTVEALKVATKDYIAFDTDLLGFGVRVITMRRGSRTSGCGYFFLETNPAAIALSPSWFGGGLIYPRPLLLLEIMKAKGSTPQTACSVT